MPNQYRNEKQPVPPRRRGRPLHRLGRTCVLLALVSIVLLGILSGDTLAYLFTKTEPLENIFTPGTVTCQVIEEFDGTEKTDVKIKNTGNTQSYIRAAIVVTWMSADGAKVTAAKPVLGTDYALTLADTTWEVGADGFYYYTLPVDAGAETAILIESCKLKEGAAAPDGFYLSVEIVASAIQSTPAKAVTESWSGVSEIQNGKLVIGGTGE